MFQKVKHMVVLLAMSLLVADVANAADPSLVGWWKLDDGSGTTAKDSSVNESHGTLNGGAVWAEGVLDGALELDGSTGNVEIPATINQAVINKGDFSMMAWIKTTDIAGTNYAFQQGDGNGTGRSWLFTANNGEITTYVGVGNFGSGVIMELDEWYHAGFTVIEGGDSDTLQMYVNGVAEGAQGTRAMETCEGGYLIGSHKNLAAASCWPGLVDDVRLYNRALTSDDIKMVMLGTPELASGSLPGSKTTDVLRDVTLSWIPGQFAAAHDVYLSTEYDDVNDAGRANPMDVQLVEGQDANSIDGGRLEFGTTYYWRVDEVNAAPDKTLFKGAIWSFTVEPYSIQIPGADIVATASSSSNEESIPEKTLDGSGLGADDAHVIATETMWFTTTGDLDPWIQYEFDAVKKLDTMKVWNSNSSAEGFIGYGVKEVKLEYSVDGETWKIFNDVNEFDRAPGVLTYNQYDEIALGGLAAKMVRLNIQSNWGGFLQAYSLSEVQFDAIPASARTPEPASGSTDILPDVVVSWRAGREADQHVVYMGTDPNEVAGGLASSTSTGTNSLDLSQLDLALGQVYYWRVDEVNEVEMMSVWAGPVWSLSTSAFLVVDDFESYTNESPNRPFQTWLDGFGFSGDEFFPAGYGGNGTGSGVGHDIWSVASPHYNGSIMESTLVKSGSQSMPLYFNNTNGLTVSETQRTFDQPQDWTVNGITSLSLSLYGDPGNTGQLYLKINNAKVYYEGLPDGLQRQQWIPWPIDLSTVGIDLGHVTSLTLSVEGAGATGVIYVDDIHLYPLPPETIVPVQPDDNDPNLVAHYEFEGNTDDSAGSYHGTASGDPIYTTGKSGQALSLDGVDDHVIYALAQEEVWPVYAVSLWVKTDVFGQAGYASLFNNNSSSSDFQIDVDGTDPGNYLYRGSATRTLGPVTPDWVHITVSCDGTQTSIYYNGLLADTANVANNRFGQLAVGVNRGLNNWFTGVIDDVRVFDRALSDAEALGLAGITLPIPKSFE